MSNATCPTCGHLRETFTSKEGTCGFVPPEGGTEEFARTNIKHASKTKMDSIDFPNGDFFFLDDYIDSIAEVINTAHRAAVKAEVEKAVRAEYDERCRLQSMINAFVDVLNCRMPEVGPEAELVAHVSINAAVRDAVKAKDARIKDLEDAVRAKDDLLVCYRLGKQPSEALFKRLENANAALKGASNG